MTLVGSILLHHAHPTYVSFAEDPHFPPVSFSYVPSTSPTCMAMGMKARQLPPPYRFLLNLPTCMKRGQVPSPTPFICPRSSSRPWTDSPCYNPLVTKCKKRGYLFGEGGKRRPFFFSYLKERKTFAESRPETITLLNVKRQRKGSSSSLYFPFAQTTSLHDQPPCTRPHLLQWLPALPSKLTRRLKVQAYCHLFRRS